MTPTYAQVSSNASHRNVQAAQRFNAGVYRPPMGYVSRSWDYGQRLPAAYYARGYWINDYLLYALYGPPSGFVWVRVGDDALLINRYSGEIIAVETGVFD
jgi:Ni/Co efflux regulator RcnB